MLDNATQTEPLTMQTVLATCLQSPAHGWSMGSFGAIGEFSWDEGEACVRPDGDGRLGCITERGALAVEWIDSLQPVAYEYLSKAPSQWVHGVVFCLPEAEASMSKHRGITDLGMDAQALKPEHRSHRLFDLGLQQDFVDVAIRTDDAALIATLRNAEGRDLLAADNPLMMSIIKAGPHRVFTTAMGRLEVYQPIGIEKSPEGPHTHVLPKLLASGRAFSANIPVPQGVVPVLSLHPAHPCKNRLGQSKPFDRLHHQQFQRWLAHCGREGFYAQKQATFSALAQGVTPVHFDSGNTRLHRTATRIALRQYQHLNSEPSSLLDSWLTAFDHAPAAVVTSNEHNQ